MPKLKSNLLVVAHPDDESIFFGGLVQRRRILPWHLVCVTDGNADGRGAERHHDLLSAAKALKIKRTEHWDFPDRFNARLDVDQVARRLLDLPAPKAVFTHSILGDYGHPHHQDVSLAVHRAFHGRIPVWSVAYNCYPEKTLALTPKEFKIKTHILTDVYRSETRRFIHLLPATTSEAFVQVGLVEVEHLYRVLVHKAPLERRKLKRYAWIADSLGDTAYGTLERPF